MRAVALRERIELWESEMRTILLTISLIVVAAPSYARAEAVIGAALSRVGR